jgi:hypothetical protein
MRWESVYLRRYSHRLQDIRPSGLTSSPGRIKNLFFSTPSRPPLGPTQPPIKWVPGDLSPGVKQPGREADHSSPTSTKVKKTWVYTSTPTYVFIAQCLISHAQGQLYCFLYLYPPVNFGIVPSLGHDRLLLNSFNFIVVQSSHHPTVYSFDPESVFKYFLKEVTNSIKG